ncbi:MAG: Rne/Rng family ribonuclease [Parvularculaceae bacterium]|nr:Rne/Rng family ribonuclease [Parvularculaceae bacterium]
MKKTMLIDAANQEEVRVCVLQNGKVEDFDFESASKRPVRGNIYLARVTRVEPSLQAAFVEFGGNRHGFLAFNEIHPDYYQIPVSDRRLLEEADKEESELAAALALTRAGEDDDAALDEIDAALGEGGEGGARPDYSRDDSHEPRPSSRSSADGDTETADPAEPHHAEPDAALLAASEPETLSADASEAAEDPLDEIAEPASDESDEEAAAPEVIEEIEFETSGLIDESDEESPVEESDEEDEAAAAARLAKLAEQNPLTKLPRRELIDRYKEARRKKARLIRNYKIQEVIKRRQILLVQAVKEERGTKGAALTTYLSLAGRYCVLMPNTARGGGISRKIPMASDRKRLRRVVDSLDVPNGMGLIIRTAGAKRTKAEIKRDYEYLVRLWENIRTLTLKSIAPCLIYEEASLIKRAIRDLYDKDIGEVIVEGEAGYREAKDFMKMLMPSHSRNVQPYKERTPLFVSHHVESQLDSMYQPTVRLKSGGYIVINQTEALIAVDVNSGKSTRERNIEQTALRTNLEAADEAARQMRLRDLAGLIVVDFIDMEEGRNNRAVEKRLKDALRADRARIQVGRISSFGLLELSRQRRRSGIIDGTTHTCPTCGGAGAVRSHEMAALRILRATEHEATSGEAGLLQVKVAIDVALYILNHKRDWLLRIEENYGVSVEVTADASKAGDNFEIEKTGARREVVDAPVIVRADTTETIEPDVEVEEVAADDPDEDEASEDRGEDRGGKRRRRRRGRGRGERRPEQAALGGSDPQADEQPTIDLGEDVSVGDSDQEPREQRAEDGEADRSGKRRRRRGRRGGRRNERGGESRAVGEPGDGSDQQAFEHAAHEDADAGENGSPIEDHSPHDVAAEAPEPAAGASWREPEPAAPIIEKAREKPTPDLPPDIVPETAQPPKKGWWRKALGQ